MAYSVNNFGSQEGSHLNSGSPILSDFERLTNSINYFNSSKEYPDESGTTQIFPNSLQLDITPELGFKLLVDSEYYREQGYDLPALNWVPPLV
jgi:hypothetical protein